MEPFNIMDKHNFLKMEIMETLRLVIDPELEINIIDMGLVYSVNINDVEEVIQVEMTLSSRSCPMGGTIIRSVENCLEHHYPNFKSAVNLVWEPVWSYDSISEEGKRLLGI